MIKINLASKKQSVLAVESKAGGSGASTSTSLISKTKMISIEQLKEPAVIRIIVCVAIGYLAFDFLASYKDDELKRFDAILARDVAKTQKLQKQLDETKGYEEKKKSLEADEFTLKKKIETVKKLLTDRSQPPKMLLTLSRAIPSDVWLSELNIKETDVTIKGTALGFNQISDFMKSLNESIYFGELSLKSTQQVKADNGQDIATFELAAQRRGD